MDEYLHYTLNRAAVILLPKQPALDWIRGVESTQPKLTLDELRKEPDVFLIPQKQIEFLEDAERWIYRRWQLFFETFLGDWYTDESMWPQQRTLKLFKEWFEIQFHPMIWDLCEDPIVREDWD